MPGEKEASHREVIMSENLEQQIRERAYFLWLDAGRPAESSDVFWLAAQREIVSSQLAGMGHVKAAKSSSKRKPKRAA